LKIGVCTGGGDCPGLNAAIRSIVKYAKQKKHDVIGIFDSFEGLRQHPLKVKSLEIADVTEIFYRGGTILGTFNKKNPNLRRSSEEYLSLICKGYKELKLDVLIVIGGEGTQSVAQHLVERGLNIIGIPKTIDNDLPGTEQTIGFSTCVDLVANSVSLLQSTAESHDRVMVLEVMGRDSGYISLYGGLAGGAQIILLPEILFSYEAIYKKIEERKKIGRNYSVIVVAEGAKEKDNTKFSARNISISQKVANKVFEKTLMETRVTVLGHLQRGGVPSPKDRLLATCFGVSAVDLAVKGSFGRIVVVKDGKISDTAYQNIRKWERRKIDISDPHLLSAEAIGVCLGR
jgi:ATP-dependent phosphofructokinase / diphosphate-dependent phosphofructokinase